MTDNIKENKVEKPTSFKLSKEAKELLKLLSEKSLRSQAKTLEFIIKEAAKKEGLIKK